MTDIRTVVLLGTSHKYQHPDNPSSAQFRKFVDHVCDTYLIRAIGEEMSTEVLQQKQILKSICEIIANSRDLSHKYCDPNNEERSRLGIRGETDIRQQGFFGNWDEERIEAAVRESHQIREIYWLQQLLELDVWPALFVCGANHVSVFARLLTDRGVNVQVEAADWTP